VFRNDLDSTDYKDRFQLDNSNVYTNATWRESFGEKWRIFLGTSYSSNHDDIKLTVPYQSNTILNISELSQGKAVLTRYLGSLSVLRVGGEYLYSYDRTDFNIYSKKLRDNFIAAFTEADIYISTKLVARVGGRFENSSLLKKANIAPRVSLAYKVGDYSQVSVAAGDFYQKPERDYLTQTTDLNYEKATHYIVNFQKVDDLRTFRVEGYYKRYQDLAKIVLTDTNNLGSGYAQGIDVFLRDKKTFKNVDYWLSYSYLDTKRNFRDYPVLVMPTFASKHTASIVFKRFIPKITTSVGFAYTYASGRPYYNPNNPVFLGDLTKDYHNLGVNFSYLTKIKGAFTVFAVALGNVLGIENVYSYRYSTGGDRREPVIASSNRSIFVGIFMSFGVDRRNEVNN
jgi:vitamin B12 transporter